MSPPGPVRRAGPEGRPTPSRGSTAAAVAGITGGTLWALTPLRQPIFGAGRTPDEGETFFRGYNALLVVVALLLTAALVEVHRSARGASGRAFRVGWSVVLAGHVLVVAGSALAVVLGASQRDVVMLGQDAGFLGAVLAALGALVLGAAGGRSGVLPRPAAALLVAALPLGLLGMVALDAVGAPDDILGLPLTVLYGAAWVVLGVHRVRARAGSSGGRAVEEHGHEGDGPAARPPGRMEGRQP